MVIVLSYLYRTVEIFEIFGEEGHFSNIVNMQPTHVPFTYNFMGLGSGIWKSVGQTEHFKNKKQISKSQNPKSFDKIKIQI